MHVTNITIALRGAALLAFWPQGTVPSLDLGRDGRGTCVLAWATIREGGIYFKVTTFISGPNPTILVATGGGHGGGGGNVPHRRQLVGRKAGGEAGRHRLSSHRCPIPTQPPETVTHHATLQKGCIKIHTLCIAALTSNWVSQRPTHPPHPPHPPPLAPDVMHHLPC